MCLLIALWAWEGILGDEFHFCVDRIDEDIGQVEE